MRQLRDELRAPRRGVDQRFSAPACQLGRRERLEVGGHVLAIEAHEHPVEQTRERCVVEHRLRDSGHACEILAAAFDVQKAGERSLQRRYGAGCARTVGAVAAAAVQDVVQFGIERARRADRAHRKLFKRRVAGIPRLGRAETDALRVREVIAGAGKQRSEQDDAACLGEPHASFFVARPTTTETLQCTARLSVSKHHSRSLLRKV